MVKFYKIPLLTAGGFALDFVKKRTDRYDEYYMLTKSGISYTHMFNMVFDFFQRYSLSLYAYLFLGLHPSRILQRLTPS